MHSLVCVPQISAQANKQAKTNTVSLDSRLKNNNNNNNNKKTKQNETAKQHQKQTKNPALTKERHHVS